MACCSNRANLDEKALETHNISSCCNNGFKLDVYNWLKDIPLTGNKKNIVEVRFKNTKKEYFENINEIKLQEGDIVAVEASPGHDIGTVVLTGELVYEQLRKKQINPATTEFKKIYRKAKDTDIEKWKEAIDLEAKTLLRARQIAESLKLEMKIGDVEYQGDKTKAIFYYSAEERVDFRELIKKYAEEFKIRIEMKQIGARQEAGRIGGIGSCGRELCCSKWMHSFVSVSTNAAREQELSLHPQKLAGQCGKLKCCLNFELDVYVDAKKDLPNNKIPLETEDGTLYYVKSDVLKRVMWYSYDKNNIVNLTPIDADRVEEIINENKQGKKPKLSKNVVINEIDFTEVVGQESLTRFDNKNKKKKKKNRSNRNKFNKNRANNNRKNNKNNKPRNNKLI